MNPCVNGQDTTDHKQDSLPEGNIEEAGGDFRVTEHDEAHEELCAPKNEDDDPKTFGLPPDKTMQGLGGQEVPSVPVLFTLSVSLSDRPTLTETVLHYYQRPRVWKLDVYLRLLVNARQYRSCELIRGSPRNLRLLGRGIQ